MEKIVNVTLDKKENEIHVMSLFKYSLINEEIKNNNVILTFSRDEDFKNKDEIVKLEEKYFKECKILPIWIFYVLVGLSFLCFTALLIIFLAFKNTVNIGVVSLATSLPGAILLFGATFYYYFRYVSINKKMAFEKEQKDILKELEKYE